MSSTELADVTEQTVRVKTEDDYHLAATHFSTADRERSAGSVLFSSATAVPQKFYAPCARFFAAEGFDAYTYDYRGIGCSAPPSLRGFDASVRTWAKQDIATMINFVADQHPGRPLTYIGHSVGGQLLGMADSAYRVNRAIFVSAQFGYWKLQGGREKYSVWVNTHCVLPLVTRLLGYFPWSKLARGEDLPKNVALQWAKWCRHPNYLFDDNSLGDLSGYQTLQFPLLAYCISDDDWGTRESVRQLTKRYSGAAVKYRDIQPAEFGYQSLGHFGFFKRGSQNLWQDALHWIHKLDA